MGRRTSPILLRMWALAWFFIVKDKGAYSWHYFQDSARELFTPGGDGLHLHAQHPEIEFGPVTVIVTGAVGIAGRNVFLTQLRMFALVNEIVLLIRWLETSERSDWNLRKWGRSTLARCF